MAPGRNLAPGHTVCRLTVFHNERKDREFTTDQVWGHVGPGPLDELETDRRWPTGQAFNRLMSLSSLGPPAAGLQLAGARVKRRAGGPTVEPRTVGGFALELQARPASIETSHGRQAKVMSDSFLLQILVFLFP